MREVRVDGQVLVTTMTGSPGCAQEASWRSLYAMRWNVELDLRNIKTTLEWRSELSVAEMVEKELWVYLLAYN